MIGAWLALGTAVLLMGIPSPELTWSHQSSELTDLQQSCAKPPHQKERNVRTDGNVLIPGLHPAQRGATRLSPAL